MLWQHEVNGHRFRMRSFNLEVSGYGLFPVLKKTVPSLVVSILTPINGLGAITHYKLKRELLVDEELLGTIAGNEANAILANEIILRNFKHRKLDYRDYNLFCKAFTNLLGYLVITDSTLSLYGALLYKSSGLVEGVVA